ncbi:hypothetical protein RF11_08320 [Thelohanellus kitauei]|uniref:Uncharacterized protein n=1 Tax=Thelohanellus kitauei TaxID=669202 RepID=A0A0C2IYA7_THEKT|nr:hypothetical protein RF11_08320 [Thelohanellus kitauei]
MTPGKVDNFKKLNQFISATIFAFHDITTKGDDYDQKNRDTHNSYLIQIINFYIRIWKIFCKIAKNDLESDTSVYLRTTLNSFNQKYHHEIFDDSSLGYENLSKRVHYFGKNIIQCLSLLMKYCSENAPNFENNLPEYYKSVFEQFEGLPLFLAQSYINILFEPFSEVTKNPKCHAHIACYFIKTISLLQKSLKQQILNLSVNILSWIDDNKGNGEARVLDRFDLMNYASRIYNQILNKICRLSSESLNENFSLVKETTKDLRDLDETINIIVNTELEISGEKFKIIFTLLSQGTEKSAIRFLKYADICNQFDILTSNKLFSTNSTESLCFRALQSLYRCFKNLNRYPNIVVLVTDAFIFFVNKFPKFDSMALQNLSHILNADAFEEFRNQIEMLRTQVFTLLQKRETMIDQQNLDAEKRKIIEDSFSLYSIEDVRNRIKQQLDTSSIAEIDILQLEEKVYD